MKPCRARQCVLLLTVSSERPDLAKSTTSHDKPIDSWLGPDARERKWSPPLEMPRTAEGAGDHCEGSARSVYFQRAYDWFDDVFGMR